MFNYSRLLRMLHSFSEEEKIVLGGGGFIRPGGEVAPSQSIHAYPGSNKQQR